jgi:hypothetical protein
VRNGWNFDGDGLVSPVCWWPLPAQARAIASSIFRFRTERTCSSISPCDRNLILDLSVARRIA